MFRHVSVRRLVGLRSFAAEPASKPFALCPQFLESYAQRRPPFGFGDLGEMVYFRTYSRRKPDGSKEKWADTVERVVNGSFRLQQGWATQHQRAWDEDRAQSTAQDMFERIFCMKFTPPGRGLWAMGTTITEDKALFAALNNCGFVSTASLDEEPTTPFCFLMDASMLGVGVGFDTRGAGLVRVRAKHEVGDADELFFEVPDSREGWVESVRLLLREYLGAGSKLDEGVMSPTAVHFGYSSIRAAGLPIKGFGGVSSGPGSLRELHDSIRDVLDPLRGRPLTMTAIVDLMNLIGRCVVSATARVMIQRAEVEVLLVDHSVLGQGT